MLPLAGGVSLYFAAAEPVVATGPVRQIRHRTDSLRRTGGQGKGGLGPCFAGSPKLRRYLLGVTRKRRWKARRNESAPSKPTDSATFSIEVSPTERRRRASFSRSVSTNSAGDEPKCSLKRRKNCRGERHARRARDSTDISFRGLFVIQMTSSANRSLEFA